MEILQSWRDRFVADLTKARTDLASEEAAALAAQEDHRAAVAATAEIQGALARLHPGVVLAVPLAQALAEHEHSQKHLATLAIGAANRLRGTRTRVAALETALHQLGVMIAADAVEAPEPLPGELVLLGA